MESGKLDVFDHVSLQLSSIHMLLGEMKREMRTLEVQNSNLNEFIYSVFVKLLQSKNMPISDEIASCELLNCFGKELYTDEGLNIGRHLTAEGKDIAYQIMGRLVREKVITVFGENVVTMLDDIV